MSHFDACGAKNLVLFQLFVALVMDVDTLKTEIAHRARMKYVANKCGSPYERSLFDLIGQL